MKTYIKRSLFLLSFLFSLPHIGGAEVNALRIQPLDKGIQLSWDALAGAEGYNVYRSESRFGQYEMITPSLLGVPGFVDPNRKYAYYKVCPVVGGVEMPTNVYMSMERELFGPNTCVIHPNDNREEVETYIHAIAKELANGKVSQFTDRREAFLFKPGNYDWLSFENGFYMHVAGLGKLPTQTLLDKVTVSTDWLGGKNATCNFWRAIENLTMLNKEDSLTYGVSQAAPMRRLKVHGHLRLDMGGWASGGFLANSAVEGSAGSVTQQQFFIRNNDLRFNGVNWNLVAVGNVGEIEPRDNRSVIEQTPVVYEKPFIYFENNDYYVLVPHRRTNAVGTSWGTGKEEEGAALPLSDFYVARDDRDDAQTLNQALQQGKHLLFTPGIYKMSETLEVQHAHTVILGLGLASIQPTNGNVAMRVADKKGIRIAGLVFDAGSGVNTDSETKGSPVLLQVGPKGSTANLSADPIVLSDLFFRVGGVNTKLPCRADISIEINAHSTIGDHFWVWRADHGDQVGWDLNRADYGVVVNADHVTLYGLFVEHYQKYDTYWTGEAGKTYFYQNEKAYDVPTQSDWVGPDGNGNGWAAYRVADHVNTHEAWGIGVYSVFINTKGFVLLQNAILTPTKGNITIHYPFTTLLSTKGGIEHIINGCGGPHTNNESKRGSLLTLPPSFNNVWRSTKR